jgi:hypothetical protein
MPSKNFFSQLAQVGPTAELSLEKLRLLCISHRVDADASVRMTSEQLMDLRIYMGARIVYALTGPGIAGAISQTNVFDYRDLSGPSHFGGPLSSTEVTLTGISESQSEDYPEGQVSLFTLSRCLLRYSANMWFLLDLGGRSRGCGRENYSIYTRTHRHGQHP